MGFKPTKRQWGTSLRSRFRFLELGLCPAASRVKAALRARKRDLDPSAVRSWTTDAKAAPRGKGLKAVPFQTPTRRSKRPSGAFLCIEWIEATSPEEETNRTTLQKVEFYLQYYSANTLFCVIM